MTYGLFALMFGPVRPIQQGVTLPRSGALQPLPDPIGPGGPGGAVQRGELLAELAAVLWQERELLDGLGYALLQQHAVLTSGELRWLPRADAAVAAAARAVQDHELFRAMAVEALVAGLDLDPSASLGEIAAAAGEPWTLLLTEHRDALRTSTEQIEQATARNRTLLVAGERSTRAALEQVGVLAPAEPAMRYDERGGLARRRASVLDEQA